MTSSGAVITKNDMEWLRARVLNLAKLLEVADLELVRGRLNDWQASGLPGARSEIPGRDSAPSDPVPEMAMVLGALLDAKEPHVIRSFNAVAEALHGEISGAMRSPKPTREERLGTWTPRRTPAGAGKCVVCEKEVPGGNRANERLRDGMCTAHYHGCRRAKARGQTRQGYIDSTRAMLLGPFSPHAPGAPEQ